MPSKKIRTHCTSIELDIHGIFIYIAIYHGNISIDPYDMYIYTRISMVIPVDHLLNNSHDGTSTHQDLATLFSEADKAR